MDYGFISDGKMGLTPIIDREELEHAHNVLVEALIVNSTIFTRRVEGAEADLIIYWHSQIQFWVAFSEDNLHHHSLVCGIADPQATIALRMTCQMNHTRTRINRRCRAMFLKDDDERVYFARDPQIRGMDTSTLRSHFRDQVQEVLWPDGRSSVVIVFGLVGGNELLVNISSFLHAIDWLKAREKGQQ